MYLALLDLRVSSLKECGSDQSAANVVLILLSALVRVVPPNIMAASWLEYSIGDCWRLPDGSSVGFPSNISVSAKKFTDNYYYQQYLIFLCDLMPTLFTKRYTQMQFQCRLIMFSIIAKGPQLNNRGFAPH